MRPLDHGPGPYPVGMHEHPNATHTGRRRVLSPVDEARIALAVQAAIDTVRSREQVLAQAFQR